MNELVGWLRERLDEDARVARRAADLAQAPAWDSSPEGNVIDAAATCYRYLAIGPDGRSLDDIGDHAARWDPERVLAEVNAKRRIVDAHHPIDPCDTHDGVSLETESCGTLRLLAQPYTGRPGWREEWVA